MTSAGVALAGGRLFGIDPEQPTRVRYAWPFNSADKTNYLGLPGAVTSLRSEDDQLVIECGMDVFDLEGSGPQTWVIRMRPRRYK